ncbi:MAG: TfoX/Sxy family protein [Verrucomicrobiales bacterium]|nr:TfoX/Sxy family protein [Verrucomicrobiales bacterium]
MPSREPSLPPTKPQSPKPVMAFDPDLAARVRRWFHSQGVVIEEKRMMGGLCFLANGKMCLGVESDRLMVRLDPAVYETALQRPGCRPMDFTGRPMKGFVWVTREALDTDQGLHAWAALALEFNPRALSSKSPKAVRKPNRP